MIRRALAMMIAVMFWSVQAADALVLHVGSDLESTMSITMPDDGGTTVVKASADKSDNDTGGAMTCTDSCQCHGLHHALFTAPDAVTDVEPVSVEFGYERDAPPTRIASRLNRPPLI